MSDSESTIDGMEGTTMDMNKPHSYQYGPATPGAVCDCGREREHAIHAPVEQETITLSREQWDEVRRAILYTKTQTRSIDRKRVLEEAYEQLVNQGSTQATDKHMAEWRARNERAGVQEVVDQHFSIEGLRRAVQGSAAVK